MTQSPQNPDEESGKDTSGSSPEGPPEHTEDPWARPAAEQPPYDPGGRSYGTSYPQQPAQPQSPYGGQQAGPYGPGQQPYGAPPAFGGYGQGGQQAQPYGQPPQQPPPYGSPGGMPGYGGVQAGLGGYADPGAGLAGGGARVAAAIIDWLIVAIVANIIAAPFVDWHRVFNSGSGTISVQDTSGLGTLLGVVFAVCYYALLHALWNGQTLGKKALSIRVVRAQDRGAISMGQAFGRAVLYELAWLVCCIGQIINLIMVFADSRHQVIHDKLIKTVVTKVNPGDPNPYAK